MSDQDECPKCGRTATGNWKRLGSPPIDRWRCVCGDVFTTLDLLRAQLTQEREKSEKLEGALANLSTAAALVYRAWPPAKVDVCLLREAAEAAQQGD